MAACIIEASGWYSDITFTDVVVTQSQYVVGYATVKLQLHFKICVKGRSL